MVILRLLSRLPFGVLYLISDFLFVVSFYVIRYRRKIVEKNLRNAFPEKTSEELASIEKQFYRNLCDYGVEMLKLLTISKEELSKRMKFSGLDVLSSFASRNQSIFFLASHQFNWEWILVSASINFPMDIEFVYQPVNNKFFDRFSLISRSRFGALPIKRDEVAREIVKRKHKLRGIASVADQYPGYSHDKKYITTFLNQETVFFYGTNTLAVLTQYPVLYFELKKIRRGYYEAGPTMVIEPPYEKTSEHVIAEYIKAVETTIRKYPSGWLWSHNRWKKRHLNQQDSIQNQASI